MSLAILLGSVGGINPDNICLCMSALKTRIKFLLFKKAHNVFSSNLYIFNGKILPHV